MVLLTVRLKVCSGMGHMKSRVAREVASVRCGCHVVYAGRTFPRLWERRQSVMSAMRG